MKKVTTALTPLMAALLAASVTAATPAKRIALTPVPGGMSDRLAGLAEAVSKGSADVNLELQNLLSSSRDETHKLIDEIVDGGDLESWLDAMEEQTGAGLVSALRSKPSEQVRAALHSKLERRLAKLGQEIQTRLSEVDGESIKKSYKLALTDLAREEVGVMLSAKASLEQDEVGAQVPMAPDSEAPAGSPQAPWDYYGRRRTAYAYGNPMAMTYAQQRTLAVAQQRAWYGQQLAAANWNNRVTRFNSYLYGRNGHARRRAYQRTRFPAGYYYRPDRVERVVRRGLWGAAAVAATPFALLASVF